MKIVISESQLESILFKKLLNESSTSATLFGGGIQPKTISTPDDHKKRPLGNWASDDAWDFKAPIGTSVHALTKGKVSKVYQSSGKKKSIYGTQISITGTDGYPNIFYTHLDNVNLQKGDVVEPGDYIGKITRWDAHPESSHVHIGIRNKKDVYNFMGRDGKIKDVDPNKANMEIGGLDIKGEGGILGLLKSLFQKDNTDKPVGGMDLDKLLTLILTSIGIPLTGGPKGSFNLKDKLKLLGGKKETSGEDSDLKDFASVTNRIIDKFEGGYWNGPTNDNLNKNKSGVCNDHPAKGMGRSTETLFGLDRYHGRIEETDAGKKFFKIIDDEKEKLGMNNFCKKWKHYYRGGELEQKLKDLAVKIMEERYEENMKNYVDDPETKKIIESDPGLLLHMSYATWNGNLFFKTFAESLEKAVKQGKRGKDLIDVAIHDRYNTPKTIGRTLNHPDRHEAEIKKASIYV